MKGNNIMAEQQDGNNLIACRICGQIMVKISRDVCPKCFKKEEELFIKIKSFLKANPGVSVPQVAQNCGCSEEDVWGFIKSGRLDRIGLSKIAHHCELCNSIIYEGVMCDDCQKKLKNQLSSLKNAPYNRR